MIKLKKINKILIKLIYISLFFLLLGFSYAFFTANITGSESTTTITVTGGTMDITFNGGNNINMGNMLPREAAWGTKTFTVTGNNTTTLTMNYHLNLIIESNTFSYGSLKYKLTSTNTGGNGTIAPSTSTVQDIGSGARSIFLGNGTFVGPTSGDKVHTYVLDIYFPDNGENQNYDQGKSFGAHIEILGGTRVSNEYLTDALIDSYGGSSSITVAPAGTFGNINSSTENIMYKMADDYGTSYYLRGAKNYVNNNIIFAEHQWKIVRINGDETIRLIYNGICPNNSCTINSTGPAIQIGTSEFNIEFDDNKYVGYMYGGAAGEASTSRAGATLNETSSTIKTYLDNWYASNISGTDYEDYISDTLFCNDRQLQSEVGGESPWLGYGTDGTFYAPNYRLQTNKTPSLICGLKNDRFTVDNTTIGNGALTYPIGLLTADEANIVGLLFSNYNYTHYLHTNQRWWTFSPSHWILGYAYVWGLYSDSTFSYDTVGTSNGARGVINLKPDTKIVGTGSVSDPFKVV
ncbi:MAG: hypothetical protein PHX19_01980 [Bacilli bacterium]|nr:hypothetical protein [Bacilli bacterium]